MGLLPHGQAPEGRFKQTEEDTLFWPGVISRRAAF